MQLRQQDTFIECCAFEVEEFTINLYNCFCQAIKERKTYKHALWPRIQGNYCIKYITTWQLSLETALERSLKQFPRLKSCLSENKSQPRFKMCQNVFVDSPDLLFIQFVFAALTHVNNPAEREPHIYILWPQLIKLPTNVLSNLSVIAHCLQAAHDLLYFTNMYQVSDDKSWQLKVEVSAPRRVHISM